MGLMNRRRFLKDPCSLKRIENMKAVDGHS